MGFSEFLSEHSFQGLQPRTWICVGQGFVREDLKAQVLQTARGFVGDVVIRPQDLALKLVAAARGSLRATESVQEDRVLGGLARQEVLRMLLSDSRITSGLPELRRLKRQKTFIKKLDRSIQAARLTFAHADEEAVHLERLQSKVGESPIREEIRRLAQAYEAVLENAYGVWDLPLLLRRAVEILAEGAPQGFRWPEKIFYFTTQAEESLEQAFWESIARHTEVVKIGPSAAGSHEPKHGKTIAREQWERWHTLDDAAEALVDRIAGESWQDHAVMIPDEPAVRRTLKRALDARGIPLADPRDPTRLRWDEGLKWALLPLEVVGRNFERAKVISWLRANWFRPEFPDWVAEINARGIRQGISSYAGGKLALVHSRLQELQADLGGKKLCRDFADSHLEYLRSEIGTETERARTLQWVVPFFESTWDAFCGDMARVGQGARRAPALYWLERLQLRLEESTPPADRLRPERGLALYRLTQAPLTRIKKLYFFGIPPSWLVGDGIGDYWYNERERETLSGEFAIRSAIQVRQERSAILHHWIQASDEIQVYDAQYEWDGQERETLYPLLKDLGLIPVDESGQALELQPVEKGAHPRWIQSFGAMRPVPPQSVKLSPMQTWGQREIRATDLDHYSRCGLQGLASGRWRLWDTKEPGAQPWPEIRGRILHHAIRVLLESRDSQGQFARAPESALEEAWKLIRPQGMMGGERLETHNKQRLLLILHAFCEKEREYVQRAGTEIHSLEGPELRLWVESPGEGFHIIGIPDRIDRHPDGFFIMDYKSSSSLPAGKEMVEKGYRLQLPFYALAAEQQLGTKPLGVQFVELSRKGGRAKGIFFKPWNGKEAGKITNSRSKQSVLETDPAEAWSQVQEQLLTHARAFADGRFEAKPKKLTECNDCRASDFCGKRRTSPGEGDEPSEEGVGE